MKHAIHRVRSFQQVGTYVLEICFDDSSVRRIDFEPMLEGELFGPLRAPKLFARVKLDPEVHTLVWPSGAVFDPATLHDWPEHEAAFRAAAQQWKLANIVAYARS